MFIATKTDQYKTHLDRVYQIGELLKTFVS